jgi:hypothetical protein
LGCIAFFDGHGFPHKITLILTLKNLQNMPKNDSKYVQNLDQMTPS